LRRPEARSATLSLVSLYLACLKRNERERERGGGDGGGSEGCVRARRSATSTVSPPLSSGWSPQKGKTRARGTGGGGETSKLPKRLFGVAPRRACASRGSKPKGCKHSRTQLARAHLFDYLRSHLLSPLLSLIFLSSRDSLWAGEEERADEDRRGRARTSGCLNVSSGRLTPPEERIPIISALDVGSSKLLPVSKRRSFRITASVRRMSPSCAFVARLSLRSSCGNLRQGAGVIVRLCESQRSGSHGEIIDGSGQPAPT